MIARLLDLHRRYNARVATRLGLDAEEAGDTLIEVLLTLVVLGLAALALIIAFSTSIAASSQHRQIANSEVVLDTVSQQVIAEIQTHASLFTGGCTANETATVGAYNLLLNTADANNNNLVALSVPSPYSSSYSVSVTSVQYWNGSSFNDPNTLNQTLCPAYAPESITVTALNKTTNLSYTNTFVVNYPLASGNAAINPGPATNLVISTSPVGGAAGLPFTTQPVVEVLNAAGNPVTTDLSPVSFTVSGGSGVTVTGCDGNEVNGIVTFTGCTIATPGTYTLTAVDGALTSAPSASFTVTSAAYHLAFTTQPVGAASGATLSTQPVVKIENSSNQVVSVSATLSLAASGGLLSGCSGLTTTNGIFNVSGCTFAGVYSTQNTTFYYTLIATSPGIATGTSNPFNLSSAGAAAKLVFTTQPTGVAASTLPAALAVQPVITVEDSYGNATTYNGSLTLTASSGETLSNCGGLSTTNGVFTVTGCKLSAYANGVTLTAKASTFTATSAAFNVTRTASQLVFSTQPVAGPSGTAFVVQPVILVEDSTGAVVTTSTIQISLTASGGDLEHCSGTTSQGGYVTLASCTFAGLTTSSYTMTASYSGLTSATSLPFQPSAAGVPTQLVYTTQPVAGASESVLTTQPVIKVEDGAGNVVTSSTGPITLSASGGQLTNCGGLSVVSGVVNANGCTFAGVVGTSYYLTASASSLTSATSNAISPTAAGVPVSVQLSGCSSDITWNSTCAVVAAIEDQYGNVETTDNASTITLTQTAGTGGVGGTGPYTVVAGAVGATLTGTAIGPVTITASSGALTTSQVSFTVQRAPQSVAFYSSASYTTVVMGATITYSPSATYQTYAQGSAGGTIAFASLTPSVCTVNSSGLVSVLTGGTCTVTADAAQIGNYADSGTTNFTLTVQKASQTITFANPGSFRLDQGPITLAASASSGLPVTFGSNSTTVCTVNASTGVVTLLKVGTCSITASQSGNASYNAATSVTQTFSITKGNQTITFGSIPNYRMDQSPITLSASASSGLAVSYASTTTTYCTVNSSTGVVTFLHAGTCSITVSQAGDGTNWNAASPVSQSFSILAGNRTITLSWPGAARHDQGALTLAASASSGLAVSYGSNTTTVCTVNSSSGVVTFLKVGSCSITVSQAGNADWNAAPSVTQVFSITKGNQTITFTNPGSTRLDQSPITLSASASSGLPVSFTSTTTTYCTVNSSTGVVNLLHAGTCSITASQAGDGTNWNAASSVTQSFSITKGNQTLTWTSTNPSPVYVGGATYTPSASSSASLTPTITLDATSSGCSLSAGTVSFTGAGTCKIDANQSGTTDWNAATQIQQVITVQQVSQTITFASIPSYRMDQGPITLSASASSGLAVSYSTTTSTICTVDPASGIVSFLHVGTCSITASQAGNAQYAAATPVTQSFSITKGNQTITFNSIASQRMDQGPVVATATVNSGLTLTWTSTTTSYCTVNTSGVITFVKPGTCSITVSQSGNADWNAATNATQSFSITKGNQIISWNSTAPPAAVKGGTFTFTNPPTSSSGLTVLLSIDSSSSAVCSISSATVTFNANGTCLIDANQAGDTNWNAASQVQESVTVVTHTYRIVAQTSWTSSVSNRTISYSSATPGDTLVIVAAFGTNSTRNCNTPTSSSFSGSASALGADYSWNSRDGACAYTATAGASSGSVTISFTSSVSEGVFEVIDVTGGSSMQASLAGTTTSNGSSSTSPTWSAAADSFSSQLLVGVAGTSSGESWTSPGFTALSGGTNDLGTGSGSYQVDMYLASGYSSTSTTSGTMSTSARWVTFSIEVSP